MGVITYLLRNRTFLLWSAILAAGLSISSESDTDIVTAFEPTEFTDCDRFALSSTLHAAGLNPSTNIFLFVMHPSYPDTRCSGLLLWTDKTSNEWEVLLFRLPISPHHGEGDPKFEIIGRAIIPSIQGRLLYSKVQAVIFSAHYSQSRRLPELDGTLYTIAIGRGDRFLVCSAYSLADPPTRDLINLIAETGTKALADTRAEPRKQ